MFPSKYHQHGGFSMAMAMLVYRSASKESFVRLVGALVSQIESYHHITPDETQPSYESYIVVF